MAEKKISELTAITSSELDDDDNLIIVDTSESQTKKISKSELASALVGGGDSSTLEGQDGAYYLNYNNHTNTPTIPTNNNQLTNGAGYITASSTDTLTNKSGDISQFTNDSGYVTNTITGSLHVDSDGTDGVGSGLRVADVDFYDFGSGDPSFRNTNANTRTVLRVLPNGTGMLTASSAFEFFGKDYHTDSTTYHNFRIIGDETDDYIIDTSFGSAATPDKSIKFNLGLKGGNYNSGAENILVLSGASATLGNVGIGTDTPSTKLEVAGDLTLTSTDDGATENPTLDLYRNSVSPAVSDVMGHIQFSGNNDSGSKVVYAEIESLILDDTASAENARLRIKIKDDGSDNTVMEFGYDRVQFSENIFLQVGRKLVFEGATDDANETTLTVTDPTSDNTIQLPDASGTVALDVITPLYADFYDSTTGTSIDSGAAVPWDATRNNSDATAISLSGSEITINQAGDFKIDFQVTVEFSDTGTERSDAVCYLEEYNGSTWSEIEGTRAVMYIRQDTYESTGAVSLIHTVTSGYKYRVFGTRQTGLGNLRFGQDSRITIVRLA